MNESTIPKSSQQLAFEANDYDYNPSIPIIIWLRSCQSILKQARIYQYEKTYELSYVLYMRLADLLLNKLAGHKDIKSVKSQYTVLVKQLPDILNECDKLKNIIDANFNSWEEQQKIELLSRRLNKFNSTSSVPLPSESLAPTNNIDKKFDDRKLLESLQKLNLSNENVSKNEGTSTAHAAEQKISSIEYPVIPISTALPTAPLSSKSMAPPPLPVKAPTNNNQGSSTTQFSSTEKSIEHRTTNYTEGGLPLRTLFLPAELKTTFLTHARSNTKKKLETCGILCGTLSRNAFFINYLVIPEQDSTSNTCTTKNEEKLFEIVDQRNLFVLGWIHTHPTQSCFLSSVDLHTQNSYQIMLNEAIAIVCSPKHEPNYGIFRLTDPPGIPTITKCSKSGFHPHEENNLYMECERMNKAGHVVIKKNLPFEFQDLRKP